MSNRLLDRIPFAKIVVVLAIVFGVSLGLCGLTFVFSASGSRSSAAAGAFVGIAGIIELGAMLLSAVCLVITVVVWVIAAIFASFSHKDSEPQHLFDDTDKHE